MLIPNIPLEEQERILNLIKGSVSRQKEIENQVEAKLNEISKLIEQGIIDIVK